MLFWHMTEILVVGFKIASIKNTKMLFGSKDTAIGYLHFLVLSLREILEGRHSKEMRRTDRRPAERD